MPTGPEPDLRHGRRAAAVSVGNCIARKGVLELLDALGRLAVLGDRVVHHGVLDRTASPASTPAPTSSCCPAGGNRTARSTARPWPLACRSSGGGLATCLTSSATESREWSSTRAISPAIAVALDRLASDDLWRAAVARAAGRRGAALPRWSHTAATLFAALRELTASER